MPISTVVKYDNHSLIEFSKAKGFISDGAILDRILYYTVYDQSHDSYALYSLDYSRYTNEPELIQSNLEARELFVLNNKLYVSNKEAIYNEDGDSFKKASENFYHIKSNTLIQLNPSDNSQLSLTVTKADTKKEIRNIDNVIGFDLNQDELTVYCYGEIVKIKLS